MADKKSSRLDLTGLSAQAMVDVFNRKYGANTLILASKAKGMRIRYCSSGVYTLDYAFGGGFAKNRIVELRGPYSAGKTTVALYAAADFQRRHPEGLVVFIDLEHTFDPEYAERLGCDLGRILLVSPDSGEQSVDVVSDLLGAEGDLFFIIDSIAAMVPASEISGSMDDQFMGLQARLVNRAFRVVTSRMKRSLYDDKGFSTTMIALNQLREKIGVMFGNPETTPGGKGKEFFYSQMARISAPPSKRITEKITKSGVQRTRLIATVHEFTTNKNKTGGSQYDEGSFTLYRRNSKHYVPGDIDNDYAAFKMGLYYEIIEQRKVGFYSTATNELLGKKESSAIKYLYDHPKALRILHRENLRAIREEASGDSDEEQDEKVTAKLVGRSKK